MSYLFCHYDGTSKISGTALGAQAIYKYYFKNQLIPCEHHKMETKNSAIYCHALKKKVGEKDYKVFIGGEHLITLPIFEALHEKLGGLKLVVFDAHHDSYEYPLSTHYSVFYHLKKELNVDILFVGTRYEMEKSFECVNFISAKEDSYFIRDRIFDFIKDDMHYFSVDLDCLDPKVFPAVNSPVDGGLSIHTLYFLLEQCLSPKTVAVDLVEYSPIQDKKFENLKKIRPIVSTIQKWSVLK